MKETILISIIIIFIYIFLFYNKKNVTLVKGNNNNKYLVYNDDQKNNAALILEQIVNNMFKLRNYLYDNINKYPEYEDYIKQLYKNLNDSKTLIYENDPNSKLTSFSVNKGEEVAICLKSKETGKIHNINLLMYVVIHEMAHIACPEIGHGPLFKKIFKFLTEVAIEINIYVMEDYQKKPVEYCGMLLTSTILH